MIYHYVPKCPRCNSTKTGSYINLSGKLDCYKTIARYMKKGELVRIRQYTIDKDAPNLFCEECGAEWYGTIINKKISPDELLKEMESRGITKEIINDNYYKINNSMINCKKNKRKKRKEKIKSIITSRILRP